MTRPIHEDGRVHGIVVGCRREDGRWLMIRRAAHVAAPLKVCFPGGAIEHGEQHIDAARRELREELGIDVEPTVQVWHHLSPDKPLRLFGWLGEMRSTDIQPDPAEVAEVLWLTAEEASSHPDALPGTAELIAALVTAADP